MAFAASIFDDMQAVHALGPRDRLLLQAAALLHDIGDFIRYDGHHKHTYYLVLHSDIIGLTPDERAIVANVARYHRKSLPDRSHNNFRDLEQDAREWVLVNWPWVPDAPYAIVARAADGEERQLSGDAAGRWVVSRIRPPTAA